MVKRPALGVAASVLALGCALPGVASALDAKASAWVPALGALGDTLARSDQRGGSDAEAHAVPALIAVGADAGPAASAGAEPPRAREPRPETQRWVPAFAFTSGMIGQNAEGSVSTDSTLTYRYIGRQGGNPTPSHLRPLNQAPVLAPLNTVVTRPLASGKGEKLNFTNAVDRSQATSVTLPPAVLPTSGSDLFLTPTVGASLELMTPALDSVPLKPRLFLHGDATLAFAFDRDVAKEGVPDDVDIPNPVPPVYTETQVKGVGSKTSGQVDTLVLGGGLGTALTLHLWERPFRIKPSIEFLRQDVQVTGLLTRAFRKDTGVTQQTITNSSNAPNVNPKPSLVVNAVPAAFIPIELETSDTKTYYGIGPGLELEMDAARAGPVMLTVFLSGQAYRMLGDRDITLDASQQVTDPALIPTTQTVNAQFDFHLHSWAYRSSVGLRFRWLPED